MSLIKNMHGVTFIGCSLDITDAYSKPEQQCWEIVAQQIAKNFPNQKNLLIGLTWFGPQFDNFPGWQGLMQLVEQRQVFDNLFLLSTVDPCYLNVIEIQMVKNYVQALKVYLLGNFDGPHQFNFFAIQLAENFQAPQDSDLILKNVQHVFVNYNGKPKPHRVEFVKKLLDQKLDQFGVVTLGKDKNNDLYLSIGEKQCDYVGSTVENKTGLPMDFYSLHNLDVWKKSFLYINAATEFDPINDLFCQQDTFKPMLGLRPFVINGVQRTYRWLRSNGFKTFNHYWSHIDIENGPVHDTIIELIKYLKSQQLLEMYQDMLPDLLYNRNRFFEFANEQKHKIQNLFTS